MPDDFMYDVFLSHSSKDKDVVRAVAERLRGDGLRVWFDDWEIRAGDSIPVRIEEGLEISRVLVLCMSANAFGSEWSQLESYTFRFRDPLNRKRQLIPLRIENVAVKGSLAQFRFINWLPGYRDQEYPKLLEACRPRMAGAQATQRRQSREDDGFDLDPEFGSALKLFSRGLFADAARRFGELVRQRPEDSDVRYYLVLSFLAGKRPRLLSSDTVAKLEQHLLIAMAMDSGPHLRLLCALLKHDYYTLNALRELPPTVSELLSGGLRVDRRRMDELRSTFSAPGNPLWESIVRQSPNRDIFEIG